MSADDLYFTADQAAAALGVRVTSLYAYVSRKGIRTRLAPEGRKRLYWREDVAQLAQRGAPGAQSAPTLVPTSAITLLTPLGPYYRGKSAVAMAETMTLEATAAHLWDVQENEAFDNDTPRAPKGLSVLLKATSHLGTAKQAIAAFPLLEASEARNYDLSRAGYAATSARIMRWFAALLVGSDRPSADPIHLAISAAKAVPPRHQDILRRLLVLFADHELTPATYAVRSVANAGVTPYQAASVGLNATFGRRILAGRTYSIRRFIDEIVAHPDPKTCVVQRFRDGEAIPGYSEGFYRGKDPRAGALLNALREQCGNDFEVRRFLSALDAADELLGVMPDVVLLYIFIERLLGFSHNDGALALTARLTGWLAHAFEQSQTPMSRFRTAYSGPLPSNICTNSINIDLEAALR